MVKGIHILAINETKLSSDIPDSIISINDFELERLDRYEHGGGEGGAVAFYIKDTKFINYKVVDNLLEHSLELICLEIIPKKCTAIFCFMLVQTTSVDG